jgi:outer membrane protein TolC
MIALRPAALAALLLAAAPAVGEEPLTLDAALALAARQSHDLALSRADASSADADATAAFAGVLPRLDLTASAGRQFTGDTSDVQLVPVFDPVTGLPVVDPATGLPRYEQQVVTQPSRSYEAYSLSLTLTQPLVDLGAWGEVGQARAGARAARKLYDEAVLSVAFDVTRLFYEVVKAERSLQVLEKAATRSQELVARSDALYAAGRAPKSETVSARVNLGGDRILVEQGRSRLALAGADLAVTLGRPGHEPLRVVAPATVEGPPGPVPPLPPLDELVAAARARRPALAAQAARLEAAQAGVRTARAGYLPTLSARGSYGRNGPVFSGPEGVFGDPTRQYGATAAVVLSWNLFEGRRTSAGVARAEAQAERARAAALQAEHGVGREVAQARAAAEALAREVGFAAENVVTAEQGLSLARERLEAGLASQLEIRDASLKLTQAELTLVQARIDHAVAVADLNRAVGGAL